MSFARRRIAGDVITRLRSSAPSGGAGAAGVGSGFVSGCASSTAGGATGADSAAAAASVSKTTSGAPTAMMSPGSPASLNRRLVGHHRPDQILFVDLIADGNEPLGYLGLHRAFTQVRKLEDVLAHSISIMLRMPAAMRFLPGKYCHSNAWG
jgi:hypothetical protein